MIHHKFAFPIISVVGGLILISGTVLLFLNPNSSSSSPVHKPSDEPVRGATAGVDTATPPGETPTPGPTGTPGPQRTYAAAPPFTIDPTAGYTATVKTDQGNIVIALDPKAAPQTVNNFVYLAENRFYDGLTFQRVIPGFIAQAGAPNPDGTGGPGYTIPDESSPLSHDAGAVAMAEMGTTPNSAGSQFYICLAPAKQQDGHDTVFGTVTEGLDILQKLAKRDPKDPNFNSVPALTIQTIAIDKH